MSNESEPKFELPSCSRGEGVPSKFKILLRVDDCFHDVEQDFPTLALSRVPDIELSRLENEDGSSDFKFDVIVDYPEEFKPVLEQVGQALLADTAYWKKIFGVSTSWFVLQHTVAYVHSMYMFPKGMVAALSEFEIPMRVVVIVDIEGLESNFGKCPLPGL
jgi:hypothetical protein